MDIRHKPTVALLFLKEQLLEFLFCFLHLKPRLLLLTVAFVELTAVLWCEACLSGHEWSILVCVSFELHLHHMLIVLHRMLIQFVDIDWATWKVNLIKNLLTGPFLLLQLHFETFLEHLVHRLLCSLHLLYFQLGGLKLLLLFLFLNPKHLETFLDPFTPLFCRINSQCFLVKPLVCLNISLFLFKLHRYIRRLLQNVPPLQILLLQTLEDFALLSGLLRQVPWRVARGSR